MIDADGVGLRAGKWKGIEHPARQKVNSPKEPANLIGAQMSSRSPADKVACINSEDQPPFDASVATMDAGGATKIGFLTDPPK